MNNAGELALSDSRDTNEQSSEFFNDNNKGETLLPKFRRYQLLLFFMTQTGYFVIAGSMLSTTFLEPSKVFKFFNYFYEILIL